MCVCVKFHAWGSSFCTVGYLWRHCRIQMNESAHVCTSFTQRFCVYSTLSIDKFTLFPFHLLSLHVDIERHTYHQLFQHKSVHWGGQFVESFGFDERIRLRRDWRRGLIGMYCSCRAPCCICNPPVSNGFSTCFFLSWWCWVGLVGLFCGCGVGIMVGVAVLNK